MQRREHQMPGKRRLNRDLRRFEIADLADHDDIGILTENRPQRPREIEIDPLAHLRLRHAVERVLDWIFDRHHVGRAARQSRQCRIERRRLAGSRRTGDQHDAMRLADQSVDAVERIFPHAERGQIEARRILVQQPQHDALAGARRQCRHAHIDLLVAELQCDPAILRQSFFRDVEARHDFQPRHDCRVQGARRFDDVAQHAVDPKAHHGARFVRLEVQIGRALAQRLQQQRIDHPDDRRLRSAVEQVFCRRQVLQQACQIAFIRRVIAPRQRGALVVRARKLRCERFRSDAARQQRPIEHALHFRNAVVRCIRSQQDDDRFTFARVSEHAVRFCERIRNARDERRVERRCVDD